MRRSPLISGFIHIILACLFTYFAIENVNEYGWDFFSYILILLATFDFGTGIRLVGLHFRIKKIIEQKK
ncbi:YdiK family protein [Bacillus marasmi]|uniref:YdiK family protein n=1 Tax=Bacillus marasmi TaxID=1926279 RepID=UPI0011C970DF|nr:YdiK family protein [Bacillus marasmi]